MQHSTGRTRRRTVQKLAGNNFLFLSHARNGKNEQTSSWQWLKVNPFWRLYNMQLCKTQVRGVFFFVFFFKYIFWIHLSCVTIFVPNSFSLCAQQIRFSSSRILIKCLIFRFSICSYTITAAAAFARYFSISKRRTVEISCEQPGLVWLIRQFGPKGVGEQRIGERAQISRLPVRVSGVSNQSWVKSFAST